jgi:hypothetical protein
MNSEKTVRPATELLSGFVHQATWEGLPSAIVDRTLLQILALLNFEWVIGAF